MQQTIDKGALARTARRLAQSSLLGFASAAGMPKLATPKVGDKPQVEAGLTRLATPKVGLKPGSEPIPK
jgi:hypothetical protein